MSNESAPGKILERYENLLIVQGTRRELQRGFSARMEGASGVQRLRLTVAVGRVIEGEEQHLAKIAQLRPSVSNIQTTMAESHLQEDRVWQKSIDRLSRMNSPQADQWKKEYQEFSDEAAGNHHLQAGLKILEERKRKEGEANLRISSSPPADAAPLPAEQKSMDAKVAEDLPAKEDPSKGEPDFSDLKLTPYEMSLVELIPTQEDQGVLREEILSNGYPGVDKDVASTRLVMASKTIQKKLSSAGWVIMNFEQDKRQPSLYGIRKLEDYDGLLDMSGNIPRVITSGEAEAVSAKPAEVANSSEAPAVPVEVAVVSKNPEVTSDENAPKLSDVKLTPFQREFVSYFPLEEDQVVPRVEILYSEYERNGVAVELRPDRFIRTVSRIQERLNPAGYSIIDFEADKSQPSLYGVRKLEDYEGLLDMSSSYMPRVLPFIEAGTVSPQGPIEVQKAKEEELIKKEAELLMKQINKSLENGVSLDPEIMKALQEAYDGVMGVPVAQKDIQPVTEPKSSVSRKSTSGLEDFLPELPVGQIAPVKSEAEQVIPFEQREEDKMKQEERNLLGFVFGLLAEAKERNEQYINNDDFQARLKPRREFEQDGKTLVESYSTGDIIRLFGGALEKLIKESQQPLIQWDEDTRELFHSVTTYAGDKGKNVESIRWPLRIQLIAITKALDMGSRRVKEKE